MRFSKIIVKLIFIKDHTAQSFGKVLLLNYKGTSIHLCGFGPQTHFSLAFMKYSPCALPPHTFEMSWIMSITFKPFHLLTLLLSHKYLHLLKQSNPTIAHINGHFI